MEHPSHRETCHSVHSMLISQFLLRSETVFSVENSKNFHSLPLKNTLYMTSIYLFKKIAGECGLLRILTKFHLVGTGGVEGFPSSFFMTFQVSEDCHSLSVTLSGWLGSVG